MDKLDFSDTRNDDEFKEFTDAPINMKKHVFENMEQLWHQADFSWAYQENCRKFLLKEREYIKKSNLVDLGCGKGHALIKFSNNWGFKMITGVELNREYYNTCLDNIALLRKKKPGYMKTPIGVLNMNAENYSFDKDDNFLYLFNPFGRETSRKVIKNIKTSLKLFPRKFYIIYNNPVHAKEFIENGFRIIHKQGERGCMILVNINTPTTTPSTLRT